ncbi:MAG TPA: chromate resistance protein ChrB domain-containing protein [Dongiaceae bacterium]|jgi:rhodanese-related sulfurtransferase|nr:chromate resistance protein ChrB domain-containing protein [Dongiaceae bacterium]
MSESPSGISPQALCALIGSRRCPIVIDVRRSPTFVAADTLLPTATWRDIDRIDAWVEEFPRDLDIVVYCAHGHNVSHAAAAALQASGRRARFLIDGIDGYRVAGGPLIAKAPLSNEALVRPSRWVTRERPKIDRIACPWLIRRFIDRDATFFFVPAESVLAATRELKAIPFDIPDVEFSHDGERCSFDAFLTRFGLVEPALDRLATIIRGADTARLDLAPQAAGLLALSLGLSAICGDDQEMLGEAMLLYDALYGWCRHAAAETHGWPPAR